MKMKNTNLPGKTKAIAPLIITAVILIAFNVVFFVVPLNWAPNSSVFWIVYAFTMFFGISLLPISFCLLGSNDINKNVFGLPVVFLWFWVFVSQVLCDAIVFSVGHFFALPIWAVIVVEALLFLWFIVSSAIKIFYKNYINKGYKDTDNSSFLISIRRQIDNIDISSIGDVSLKREITRLKEDVHFSDPVSTDNTKEIENEILDYSNSLSLDVLNGKVDEARKEISKIEQLLSERKSLARSQ
jgi:hypothetical protein